MSAPPRPERLAASLKGFAASLIEIINVRLELFTVEARDEALRLTELLVYGALAIAFLTFGTAFLAVLITVLLWDSHRLLALGVFSALFLGVGIATLLMAMNFARAGSTLFQASLAELARDREALAQGNTPGSR